MSKQITLALILAGLAGAAGATEAPKALSISQTEHVANLTFCNPIEAKLHHVVFRADSAAPIEALAEAVRKAGSEPVCVRHGEHANQFFIEVKGQRIEGLPKGVTARTEGN